MPVCQLNFWTCEICLKIAVTEQEVCPYSDPLICPPNDAEWDYIKKQDKELLACPACIKAHADNLKKQNKDKIA